MNIKSSPNAISNSRGDWNLSIDWLRINLSIRCSKFLLNETTLRDLYVLW